MCDQLRLHGIRHQAVSRKLTSSAGTIPAAYRKLSSSSLTGDIDKFEEKATRKISVKVPPSPKPIPEEVWERRHIMAAATKNTEWCDFYLSASATQTDMAGFLSIKDELNIDDAEYFCTYIPNAVIHRDFLYKQLLAIYNSLYYWGARGTIKGKRLLLAINDTEAGELIKTGIGQGKLATDKVLILKAINGYCNKMDIKTRVPILDLEPEETVTYALLHGNDHKWRNQFKILLATQSKGSQFRAKERLFPPIYV